MDALRLEPGWDDPVETLTDTKGAASFPLPEGNSRLEIGEGPELVLEIDADLEAVGADHGHAADRHLGVFVAQPVLAPIDHGLRGVLGGHDLEIALDEAGRAHVEQALVLAGERRGS